MNTFVLYFSDLTSEAQARIMDAAGINDPTEANWDMDVFPIAMIDFETPEEQIDLSAIS